MATFTIPSALTFVTGTTGDDVITQEGPGLSLLYGLGDGDTISYDGNGGSDSITFDDPLPDGTNVTVGYDADSDTWTIDDVDAGILELTNGFTSLTI
jgi:hypothetical protein